MADIYYQTGTVARSAGLLELYRASFRENVRVRNVIDTLLNEHFDGMHLSKEVVKNILFNATPDRVALVLANTLKWRAMDGRFSQANRTWAAGIRLPDIDPEALADTSSTYACQTHSAILNGFIDLFRRYMDEHT